jgi:hypothetical protein
MAVFQRTAGEKRYSESDGWDSEGDNNAYDAVLSGAGRARGIISPAYLSFCESDNGVCGCPANSYAAIGYRQRVRTHCHA